MKITFSTCRSAILAASIPVMLTLGGCASPVTHEAMVPQKMGAVVHHPQSVAVAVTGGNETSAAGKSQVSNAELQQAVIAAIDQSKVFARTVQGNNGDYVLNVTLVSLDQPNFGFSFTVGAEMGWSLTKADTGAVVWRESIKSQSTAGATDAFAGVTRLKMATEGAVRENIQTGLGKLSALNL